MKKLFLLIALMLVPGIVMALPGPQVPESKRATSKSQKLTESQQLENSIVTPSKSPNGVLVSAPATQPGASQLIRSAPYQPNNGVPQDAVASSQSVVQSGSQSSKSSSATKTSGGYVVACKVGGYEEKNVSADDCKAKGGVEVMTPEITKEPTDKSAQKH